MGEGWREEKSQVRYMMVNTERVGVGGELDDAFLMFSRYAWKDLSLCLSVPPPPPLSLSHTHIIRARVPLHMHGRENTLSKVTENSEHPYYRILILPSSHTNRQNVSFFSLGFLAQALCLKVSKTRVTMRRRSLFAILADFFAAISLMQSTIAYVWAASCHHDLGSRSRPLKTAQKRWV